MVECLIVNDDDSRQWAASERRFADCLLEEVNNEMDLTGAAWRNCFKLQEKY